MKTEKSFESLKPENALEPVKPEPVKPPESSMRLKKLEPYELPKPTIPKEFLDPIEQPDIMPSLMDNPIIMPEVDQELLELMRQPPITIDESDPFELPKPVLLITQGKINGHKATVLFDVRCLPDVIPYETFERLNIKVRKRPEYISVMANKTRQEIGETIEPVPIDLHYYKEKKKFVVAPCQYDVIP